MPPKLQEERRKAAPAADDLQDAREVWKNGEVAPSGDVPERPQTGPLGRVADAGDIGAGTPSVYGVETQADVVGGFGSRGPENSSSSEHMPSPGVGTVSPRRDRIETMDHSTHTRLPISELTPAVLDGATIYGADDHKVGSVSHVHGSGVASAVIVDVGGFLGIGAKPVSIPLSQLEFMRDEKGSVHAVTAWTKEQVEKMPEHHH